MKHQNFILLSQQSWDTKIGTNARNMAREFAKDNQVLYVNMPLDMNTVLRGYRQPHVRQHLRVLLGQAPGVVQVEPNIWVCTPDALCLSINWLSSRQVFSVLNKFNSRVLARSIRKAVQAIGFDEYFLLQDGLVYQGLGLKRLLKPKQSIYNLRDYVLPMPYFRRHGPWLEAASFEEADVVVANSAYLADYARPHNPRSYNVGQGCVLTRYQAHARYEVPTDLLAVPGPRICYTGYLTGLRLDVALLLTLAQRRPDWHWVLVGDEDQAFLDSALHELPNVHFLGGKTPDQLPAYLSHCDVCINPQIVNDITIGNYPLKIDEYLAMGKPVVATTTIAMEMFLPHVYLATGPDEWQAALATALAEPPQAHAAARVAFAQTHTWTATVDKLYAALAPAG